MSGLQQHWFEIGGLAVIIFLLSSTFMPVITYRNRLVVLVKAPIEKVRFVLFEYLDTAGLLGVRVHSREPDAEDSTLEVMTCSTRYGNRFELKSRILSKSEYSQVASIQALKFERQSKLIEYPFGRNNIIKTEIRPIQNGIEITYETVIESRSIICGLISSYASGRSYFRRLRNFCEGRKPRGLFDFVYDIGVYGSALSVVILLGAVGWLIGIELCLILLIHEFGHVLGFRLVGEQVIGVRFIPFLGAMTMGTPPKTATHKAIVALSGVIFSLLPILVVLMTVYLFNLALTGERFDFKRSTIGDILMGFAELSVAINLFQLVPIPMLDGGETLTAALSWFGLRVPVVVIGGFGVMIACFAYSKLGIWIFSILIVVCVAYLIASIRGYDRGYSSATLGNSLSIFATYGLFVSIYISMFSWLHQSDVSDINTWQFVDSAKLRADFILKSVPLSLKFQSADFDQLLSGRRTGFQSILKYYYYTAPADSPTYWEMGSAYWVDTLLPQGEYIGPRLCAWCVKGERKINFL
jgi:Zn-dependent protease